jgi:hypothetical protein
MAGNKKPDTLARKGSAKTFTGPAPVLESLKPQPIGPFLRGLNCNTRHTEPTWQVKEQANDGQTII